MQIHQYSVYSTTSYMLYQIHKSTRVSKHNFLGQECTIVEEKLQKIGKH